jgi:hypothetical protein
MTTSTLVTKLVRLTEEAYGQDCEARVYKLVQEDGSTSFAVSLLCNDVLIICEGDFVSYGAAMRRAVQWMDNSQMHL